MDLFEAMALEHGERVECPVNHVFTPGLYIREFHAKADTIVASRIHNIDHPFFVMKGLMTVRMEDDTEIVLKGGDHGITNKGTRRLLYIHEDCIFITVHANPDNETDPDKIVDAVTEDYTNPLTGVSHSAMTKMQYAQLPDERPIPALP